MKPLAIDLFCGLGGWADGFLMEGYDVVGFDIERHDYGTGGYPGQLVLQDILTLHGAQFRDAAVIVASPPCQAYSYRAMPWKRAKALPPPSNELFDACFRIQREAIQATGKECPRCDGSGVYQRRVAFSEVVDEKCAMCDGWGAVDIRHIPLVVENVKGAQPWVGRAKWHYGSFYLWGDVPALMPPVGMLRKSQHDPLCETPAGTGKTSWFFGNSKHEARYYGLKVPMNSWSGYGKPGYKAQGFNVTAAQRYRTKQGLNQEGSGAAWFDNGLCKKSSRSDSRKAASAQIAKIPLPLASHIARVFKP